MAEQGFLQQRNSSPASLGIVIAIHAAGITALALSKMEVMPNPFTPIELIPIQTPPDPPPQPQDEPVKDPKPQQKSRIERVVPIVDTQPQNPVDLEMAPEVPLTPLRPVPPGPIDSVPADPPKPEPVRVEAHFDPRYADRLQPPYPASEERAGNEGKVTVRVLIGADGRVKAVEKLAAASDAFDRATERHALSNWRFKPATLDGKPVESRKVMTLRFELTG